jgi:hypothetical protein
MTTKETLATVLDRVEALAADNARLTDRIKILRADRHLIERWNKIKEGTKR